MKVCAASLQGGDAEELLIIHQLIAERCAFHTALKMFYTMKVTRLICFYRLWKDRWILSLFPVKTAMLLVSSNEEPTKKQIISQMKLADAH